MCQWYPFKILITDEIIRIEFYLKQETREKACGKMKKYIEPNKQKSMNTAIRNVRRPKKYN